MKNISTFSIVARDAASGDLGIAVQSKFLAVGNGVLWAKAGVGAVVTQALANMDFGELGLHILEKKYDTKRKIGEHTSELQSLCNLVCRLLLEKKKG